MKLKLTGKFSATYDSVHVHWVTNSQDLNNIYYDDKLVKIFGIEKEKFPSLIRSTDILGTVTNEVADEIGLPHDVKVMGGSGDLHMAAIGSGAVKDFEGHIYLGTSSFLLCHCPKKISDPFHSIAHKCPPAPHTSEESAL